MVSIASFVLSAHPAARKVQGVLDSAINGNLITPEWIEKLNFETYAFDRQLIFIDPSIYDKAQPKLSASLYKLIATQANKTVIIVDRRFSNRWNDLYLSDRAQHGIGDLT